MSGQTMSFSEKQKVMDDFIERVDPYKKQDNLIFDLRGYAKYLEKNAIPGNRVPDDVVRMFKK